MTPEMVEELVQLVLLLRNTHRAGRDVAQIVLNIIRKGVQGWEDETGKPLTPDLIRAEKSI